MTATSDTAPPAADTAPSFTDRVARIAALGWSDREATWIALVALHTGVFLRSQLCHFLDDSARIIASLIVRTARNRHDHETTGG